MGVKKSRKMKIGREEMMRLFLFDISDGKEHAWTLEALYERYRDVSMRKALRILRHKEDAEDAVSNAWITIARNLPYLRYQNERALSAYIMKTVQMKAISILQEKETRGQRLTELEETADIASDEDILWSLCEKETVETLMKALAQLKKPYRDVLTLYYLHELPPAAVSETLDISERTVWTNIYRGRQKLIEILEGKEGKEK